MKATLMFVLIAVICLIGILAGRKVKSAAQWANGGKNLNWVTVGILLVTFQIGEPLLLVRRRTVIPWVLAALGMALPVLWL